MVTELTPTLSMDFAQLGQLSKTLDDHGYVEYIWHKFFTNPNEEFQTVEKYNSWQYPECWLARYWLTFVKHKHIFQNANVLDLGANMNIYGVWCLLNGAKTVHAIEPDKVRFKLGLDYAKVRKLEDKIVAQCITINNFMQSHCEQLYDVVLLQDVLYYVNNHIEILSFVKNKIKPKFLLLESTIVNDCTPNGHMQLWYPSTNTKDIQSITNENETPLAMVPSRIALRQLIEYTGWEIVSYYDYKDFIGHGESPPRKAGLKDFYLLKIK